MSDGLRDNRAVSIFFVFMTLCIHRSTTATFAFFVCPKKLLKVELFTFVDIHKYMYIYIFQVWFCQDSESTYNLLYVEG